MRSPMRSPDPMWEVSLEKGEMWTQTYIQEGPHVKGHREKMSMPAQDRGGEQPQDDKPC